MLSVYLSASANRLAWHYFMILNYNYVIEFCMQSDYIRIFIILWKYGYNHNPKNFCENNLYFMILNAHLKIWVEIFVRKKVFMFDNGKNFDVFADYE